MFSGVESDRGGDALFRALDQVYAQDCAGEGAADSGGGGVKAIQRNNQKTIRYLDICRLCCYNRPNFIETVEAEIKAAMPSQRVRKGESRAGNKPPNGPRRAQSKAEAEYSAT